MVELTLEGSPFERGQTHGEFFSQRIREDAPGFWEQAGGEAFLGATCAIAAHTEKSFPEIVEEIRGIASGAGISFEQAFLFNNRSIVSASREGCSAVAIIRDGASVLGMNKDSKNPDVSGFFVARVKPDSGHAWVGYKHVGRVWGYGINDCGLCAAGTSAEPVGARNVVPSIGLYLLGPIVLSRCATVAEAVEPLMDMGEVSESGNVLFGDENDAAVVEFGARERILRRPDGGLIATTNFYASGGIQHAGSTTYLDETRARYANILRMASSASHPSTENMKRILSHHDENGSVCRHSPEGDRTVFSFIAASADRTFLVTSDSPCQSQYTEYRVS